MLQFLYLRENFSCKQQQFCEDESKQSYLCLSTGFSDTVKSNSEVVEVFLLPHLDFFDFVLLKFGGQIAAVYSFTMYLAKLVNKVKI